jgi:hypothetical protein
MNSRKPVFSILHGIACIGAEEIYFPARTPKADHNLWSSRINMQDVEYRPSWGRALPLTHRSRQAAQARPTTNRLRSGDGPVARTQHDMGAGVQSDPYSGVIYSA